MNKRFFSVSFALLVSGCLFAVSSAEKGRNTGKIPHAVEVFHPGSKGPIPLDLMQMTGGQGAIEGYFADVDSVICGDGQCEIITVRLVWDAIGQFSRYEFPKGGDLTKKSHKKFTPADHEKLRSILSNPDSALKDVDPKAVVAPGGNPDDPEVDGSSGATLLSDQSAIVPGAVYTCYTLWHWVNGEIPGIIREISASEIKTEQLSEWLRNGSEPQMLFSMKLLAERKTFEKPADEAVVTAAENGSMELASAALDYFRAMAEVKGTETYFSAVERLFAGASGEKRVLILGALTSVELVPPEAFSDWLSAYLSELENYYEVHLMLNLFGAQERCSETVIRNTLPLLERPSFLVGRRAFNFLKDKPLTPDQQAQVNAFGTKYANRL